MGAERRLTCCQLACMGGNVYYTKEVLYMNKPLQECINRWCMDCLDEVNAEITASNGWLSVKRLRTCSAQVYETEHFYILQSYRTFGVAIIRKSDNQCYDILRYLYGYTSTSAQHICKFMSDYGDRSIGKYTYR